MASDIHVQLDDRVRLMSAALAATRYPELAQAKKAHGTHAHARATRKHLSAFANHAAVKTLQSLIDKGAPLEAIFTLALAPGIESGKVERAPRWMPPGWDAQLHDFRHTSGLEDWWQSEDAHWLKSLSVATRTLVYVALKAFLLTYMGEIKEKLVFIPNISYPTDHELGLRVGSDLVAIVPPRLAWGDSPPWPYDEDPAHLYRAVLVGYGRLLMTAFLRDHAEPLKAVMEKPLPVTDQFKALYPTWAEQFASLFVGGAVAIYLEDHVNQAEANAFVLMERKVHGMALLPGVVSVLRRYLSEVEAGRYTSLADFLPLFPKQLRIAKRIVSL
jgi:hypothetical protein